MQVSIELYGTTRKLLHVENILGVKDKNARRIQIF